MFISMCFDIYIYIYLFIYVEYDEAKKYWRQYLISIIKYEEIVLIKASYIRGKKQIKLGKIVRKKKTWRTLIEQI